MKVMDLILLVVLIALIFIGGNILLTNLSYFPKETLKYEAYVSNLTVDAHAAKVAQFYPNMRYQNATISYTIEDACSLPKIESIEAALRVIEENTLLEFVQRSSDGEIKYTCSNEAPEAQESNHFVAGEGGPTGIVNTTLFSVITNGQVSLYRQERCDRPQVALHETLHALGFDHVKDRDDIMFPVTECDQEPSETLFEAIDDLYSIRSAPDLGIEYVSANQTGRFLNFFITISNYGVRDSNEAYLIILADGDEVREFSLGKINYGTKKFLNVQNMRIDNRVDIVKFVLRISGDDLYDDNDFAEIYLSYDGS